jgi:hypothetical protein
MPLTTSPTWLRRTSLACRSSRRSATMMSVTTLDSDHYLLTSLVSSFHCPIFHPISQTNPIGMVGGPADSGYSDSWLLNHLVSVGPLSFHVCAALAGLLLHCCCAVSPLRTACACQRQSLVWVSGEVVGRLAGRACARDAAVKGLLFSGCAPGPAHCRSTDAGECTIPCNERALHRFVMCSVLRGRQLLGAAEHDGSRRAALVAGADAADCAGASSRTNPPIFAACTYFGVLQTNGEKVHIIGHVPPGEATYQVRALALAACCCQLNAAIQRFFGFRSFNADLLRGDPSARGPVSNDRGGPLLRSHAHGASCVIFVAVPCIFLIALHTQDGVQVFRDAKTNTQPIAIGFISPSVTPQTNSARFAVAAAISATAFGLNFPVFVVASLRFSHSQPIVPRLLVRSLDDGGR